MPNIKPCLWFDQQAEEAAAFYVSLFPNSRILATSRYGDDAPMPAGTVLSIEFELDGMTLQALNGGPAFSFTEAISLSADAPTQADIDRLWNALTADGGEAGRCGWLKDRYGLSWQIVPPRLGEMLSDPDPAAAARVMQAMLPMGTLELAVVEDAYTST